MIAISQLLQVLQAPEAAVPQPAGPPAKSSAGGIAQLFGAILEQARAALGGHATLENASTVPQTETGTDIPDSGDAEGDEVVARGFEGLPVEHAASVLEALSKFETLPIEHAISVLQALSARAEAAIVDGGEESESDDSETDGDTGEVAIPGTVTSVDEVVGELLAAMSAVPVQVAPLSEDGKATQTPALATQSERGPASAPLGPTHAASAPTGPDTGVLAGALKATEQPMESEAPGLPPVSALLRAAAKSAAQEGPSADLRGPGVAAPTVVEGGAAPRATLSEAFARAVTRQQAQSQPTQGADIALAATTHLESLEALAPALKPQGAPAQALALPGAAEGVLAAVAPKGDAAVPQSIPERPPPEVVHVRQLGDFTVKTVRYLAGRNEEVVTVRLVPRSLGELHIAVRTVGQSLDVVMTAATHAAREAIEAQLPGLREALGRGGVDVVNITVQTSTAGDQATGHSATSGHAAGTGTRFTGGREEESQSEPRGSPRGPAEHEGSLNMFV